MVRRTLIFNPYLPVLGGGERYTYFIAQAASETNEVVIGGPRVEDARLSALGFDTSIPRMELTLRDFSAASAEFDSVFYLTNEIPRQSRAKKSVLIVQFPYEKPASLFQPRQFIRQHRNLASYDQIIVYSRYSQEWTWKRWRVRSEIVAPPVTLGSYDATKKQPIILAVGRFFVGGHSKRQDVLIDAFIELEKRCDSSWQLVLVGGCYDDPVSKKYLADLRQKISGHRIAIYEGLSAGELAELYQSATFFWHATGFGRSPDEPQNAEHFGMTTVEAMSYGAVPLVYADGGQPELVDETCGRLWHSVDELVSQTFALIAQPELRQRAAAASVTAAEKYSFDIFAWRIRVHYSNVRPRVPIGQR
jgi:glycosyltransferase involved in cell wall biosynthesis